VKTSADCVSILFIALYIAFCLFVCLPCVVLFGLMATRLNKHDYYYIYLFFIVVGVAAARCSTSGNVPVSHLANVEALVQRAAAEAARCGSAQMEHNVDRQSSIPRGAPPSYAASTGVVCVEPVLRVILCIILAN